MAKSNSEEQFDAVIIGGGLHGLATAYFMAKEQGISLAPSEITGMCGRLRCCLIYEYEQYAEARKKLPCYSGTERESGYAILGDGRRRAWRVFWRATAGCRP